jgi:maltooligosyltrehalose trehalohydrolase
VDFPGGRGLERALTQGFAFQGQSSEYFGRPRGTPSGDLPGQRFVVFAQNHDQIGNRAQGERLGALVSFEALKLAAGLLFVAPAVPLLFMGEEYGETAPFQFFTSFLDRELAEAVWRGRTAEFSRFAWEGTIPDPGEPATFVRSRLNHALASAPRHRELREYYRQWLVLRRQHPALGSAGKAATRASLDEASGTVLTVTRESTGGPALTLVANLGAKPHPWRGLPGGGLLLDSDARRFGGTGTAAPLAPFQVLLYEMRG